ncbi:MAG: biopolymer transporter ExbD [Methylotenera sp.]|jgi:biopolymer transport protein ExbD|uniref:ExbD/TolR family protein n=1 Tax=Methylotenera sp. TaxID=2051956 RepID=UPI00272174B4|nr:biopolymer transporter ExbD [Methylotenera sp.]MDO9204153.1 biopolymer transporter ExbD [Methylotenera sp.]MDO9393552.1 biopolymer transporter ExbD [Methylotenera sp.]MDP1523978.1 biopolymer transporter ExbD [Methylotenera sp.]MDP2230476.1 biopolymer transporter ExbD [Methylotenera sp.]MDP3140043.1 biopolymer transporter ExbD [Methylotenera sp.]
MNFQRGRRHEEFEMNLIPLIDVLLVIIIFLIVSATFSRTSELQINLPTAEANTPQEKPLTIEVGVDASGKYVVNGKGLADSSVSGISAALQAAANGGKEPTIIINADAKTTHQSVIDVMEASRTAGYTHITFATQSKAGS